MLKQSQNFNTNYEVLPEYIFVGNCNVLFAYFHAFSTAKEKAKLNVENFIGDLVLSPFKFL